MNRPKKAYDEDIKRLEMQAVIEIFNVKSIEGNWLVLSIPEKDKEKYT